MNIIECFQCDHCGDLHDVDEDYYMITGVGIKRQTGIPPSVDKEEVIIDLAEVENYFCTERCLMDFLQQKVRQNQP